MSLLASSSRLSRARVAAAGALVFVLAAALLAPLGCGDEGAVTEGQTVTIVQIPPGSMEDALAAGEIDGFIAWEPFPAKAVASGAGSYLVGSGEIWPDHPCCVLAASAEGVDPQTMEAFLWAHAGATEFLIDPARHEEVIAYAVEFTSAPEEVVRVSLDRLSFSPRNPVQGLRRLAEDLTAGGLLPAGLGEDFWDVFGQGPRLSAVEARMGVEPGWTPVAGPGEFRLGYIAKDLHQLALHVALEEGYFAKAGLVEGTNLSLRPYPNGVAIMQAFSAGELDAAYLGAAPALLKSVNDRVPIAVVGGANQEGSALVVGAGIDSVEDLAGLRVAVPQVGTVQHVLLLELLERHGLQPRLG